MKFIIKHEILGRIRVHMVQPKMTFEEADILLYYLVNLENVTKAKVYERTQDAVIYYEKDRREIIKALQKFGYDRVTVPEGLTEHSGRQMNAEYQEKLLMKVVMRFGGKLLIPAPVRAVWTGVRSLKYLRRMETPIAVASRAATSSLPFFRLAIPCCRYFRERTPVQTARTGACISSFPPKRITTFMSSFS